MADEYVVYVAEPAETPSSAARRKLSDALKLDDAKLAALLRRLPAEVTKPVSEATALTVARRFREAGLEAFIRPWKGTRETTVETPIGEGLGSSTADVAAPEETVPEETVPEETAPGNIANGLPRGEGDSVVIPPPQPTRTTQERAGRRDQRDLSDDFDRPRGRSSDYEGDEEWRVQWSRPVGDRAETLSVEETEPKPIPGRRNRPGREDQRGSERTERQRTEASTEASTPSVEERRHRQRDREPEVEVFSQPEPVTKSPSRPLLIALILVLAVFVVLWLLL